MRLGDPGIGGLGHMAVQYAKAMGLNVAAVDVDDARLDLARLLGAILSVNAAEEDPVVVIRRETDGGAQGVLVTVVRLKACARYGRSWRHHVARYSTGCTKGA